MITEIRIPVEGEDDIVLGVDYDSPGHLADLDRLDADLKLIDDGKLDVEIPPDNYDYASHQWESKNGKSIGRLCAYIDKLSPAQQERLLVDDGYLEQVIAEAA